jgi:hypothetical protein
MPAVAIPFSVFWLEIQSRWIGLDPIEAMKNGEDKYVVQALLRLQAWDPSYNK